MRVTTTKSKTDESFYINYAFINEKGKSTSRIYKKLGKLSELSKELNTDRDGVMAWAKEQARIETEKYKKRKMNQFLSLLIQIFQSRRISRTLLIVAIFFYKAYIILYIWIISAETSKTDMTTNTI